MVCSTERLALVEKRAPARSLFVWTAVFLDDGQDGIVSASAAAEITAETGRDPARNTASYERTRRACLRPHRGAEPTLEDKDNSLENS